MKRFKKQVKTYIWLFSTSLALYWLLHYYGTLERGYEAQGGEILAPVAVVVAYLGAISLKDLIVSRLMEIKERG